MDRETFNRLLRFCVDQQRGIRISEWRTATFINRRTLAMVALFLASKEWYGAVGLQDVAAELDPSVFSPNGLLTAATSVHFDFPRFSSMLKRRLVRPNVS